MEQFIARYRPFVTAAPSAIRQTSFKRLIGTHPTPAYARREEIEK